MASPVEVQAVPLARSHPVRTFATASAGLGLIALLGYSIFLLFLRGGSTIGLWGAFAVAVIAGIASFFSPCSFPLLPGYLGYYMMTAREHPRRSALAHGFSAAAGVATFGLILGAVLGLVGVGLAASFSLVGPIPSPTTQGLRFTVGAVWLALGAVQLGNVSFHGALERFLRIGVRPAESMFAYGFGYTVAGIGCTAPFLASVAVLGLAAGGLLEAIGAVAVFVLTMVGLMVGVSLMAARSVGRLKAWAAATPRIKEAGGVLLAIVGGAMILLTAWPQLLRPLFP